jgi:SAM-dependent methyltransferase
MTIELHHPDPIREACVEALLPAIGGFPQSDMPLFIAGYYELCRVNLIGKRVLEICGGYGRLAGLLAEGFPETIVTGLDLYVPDGPEINERLNRSRNLSYVAGDAFDLSTFPDESFDLVFGQAALHHLAHDSEGLCRGVRRILKPGGRLVFIFEPLGHNLVVAAIRAIRMARHELPDESNLYLSQFEQMAGDFSRCEVQIFNLLGYPMKALSDRMKGLSTRIHRIDAWLFRKYPKLLRYGANCNLILTK